MTQLKRIQSTFAERFPRKGKSNCQYDTTLKKDFSKFHRRPFLALFLGLYISHNFTDVHFLPGFWALNG